MLTTLMCYVRINLCVYKFVDKDLGMATKDPYYSIQTLELHCFKSGLPNTSFTITADVVFGFFGSKVVPLALVLRKRFLHFLIIVSIL